MKKVLLTLTVGALCAAPAFAQETIDVGVLKMDDISVVQKLLYPKSGRLEVGGYLGWMPFDTFTTTPIGGALAAYHLSETLGAELALSGGYGLKSYTQKQLESPAYGIAPDSYRHLGALSVNAQWSPIYAKMNWRGKKILHHDIYGLAGFAAAFEQSFTPDKDSGIAPGGSLGVGMRIFLNEKSMIRVQLRDDLLIQSRTKTEGNYLKQNVGLTVGYSWLKPRGS